MSKAIQQAERALARGRADEALVYLWNALELARVAGDAGSLEGIVRVARRIEQAGDPAEQREAVRLLETLRPPAPREDSLPAPVAARDGDRYVADAGDAVEGVYGEPAGPDEHAPKEGTAEASDAESPRGRGGLRRRLVPLVFLAIFLVNLVVRLADR